MTRVTDEMVEAALRAQHDHYPGYPFNEMAYRNMRVALEAALAIAPKDESSERKSAFEAAEASAWPELEWAGEKKP